MSASFITGKPGGGKSMLATRLIIKELLNGVRHIITNVPLEVENTVNYIRARYGREIDPARIEIITDREAGVFCLRRAGGHVVPMPASGTNGEIDYSVCTNSEGHACSNAKLESVLYVIDEAHNLFGARDWAKTGKFVMWYLSQHRHFGDDVLFVTQHWKNVDSAFRRVAQQFTTTVNLAKRKAFGFRLPDVFLVRTFDSEPTPYATEVWSETHRLDVEGLCSCYRTVAVKNATAIADTQQKKEGWHWGWGIAAVVVLLCSVFLIPIGMGKGAGWIMNKGTAAATQFTNGLPATVHGTNAAPVVTNNVPVPVPAPAAVPMLPPRPVPAMNGQQVLATPTGKLVVGPPIGQETPVRVKFYIKREGGTFLGLDNGDTFMLGDGRLVIVGQLAILDGNRVFRLPQ